MLNSRSFSEKWSVVSLGEAVTFLDNLRKPVKASDRVEGNYLYYGANGIQGTINEFIFDEPLLLLAEDGGHFGNPDRDIAYIAKGKYWVNNHAHVLKPNEGLDLNFLYRVLQRYDVSPFIKGATRAKLTKGDAARIPIPLPPLAEQQRIAAILDKADAIRRKRQQAIQLADDFLRAVFLDMFGDPVTNPKGWPTMRVEEICTIVRGSSPRPQGDPRYYGGPVPRLMVADLTRDGKRVTPSIDSLTEEGAKKSRPIKAGTVVMAVSGNVGLTSVLAINACIHDGFIAFKELDESKVKAAFLCELMMFLKSTHASRQAGAIFQNLTTSQIKEMDIPIPPTSLQDKFLEICVKGDQLYGQETPGLFESLSQKAFRGEL